MRASLVLGIFVLGPLLGGSAGCRAKTEKPADPVPAASVASAQPSALSSSAPSSSAPSSSAPSSSASSAAAASAPSPAPSDVAATPRPLEYDRPITPDDLKDRTLRELTLMRNSIWARQGKKFDKKWLADHFAAQPWYQPKAKIEPPNELGQKNLELIGAHDVGLKRDELLARANTIRARIEAGSGTPDDRLELRLLSERLGEWSGGDVVAAADRTPLEDPSKLDQLIDPKALADMSRRDLRLLRNTIYARRGRPFVSPSLRTYFAAKAWYHSEPKYTDEWLTPVDKKNIVVVLSAENERGGAWNEDDERFEEEMKKNMLMYGA